MTQSHPVIDADSHKCENPLVFLDYVEEPYRSRISFVRDRYGEQRFRILDQDPKTGRADLARLFLQPDGYGKGTYRPYHEESTLGGLFNRVRIEHMDREGVDHQLIYGSITLGFSSLVDPELSVALCRAYNDYIFEDCHPYRDRLHPVAVLPLQDPTEAIAEMRRCVNGLGMAAVSVSPHLPIPHPAAPDRFPDLRLPKQLSHPDFRPLLREAERLDVAIGIHGAPGMYLAAGAADQLDSFTLVHVFANRTMQQTALAKLIFDGVLEELPGLRLGFLEAGCGWLPDFIHSLHEHWEKRVVGLDPRLEPSVPAFLAELARERNGAGGPGLARKARGLLSMLFSEAEDAVSAEEKERFLYEHPHLRRDPVEYLERGQIFLTFEPDDPAPAYLPDALGSVGEQVACWAVDYGHWDATLKDCVGLVSNRPGITAPYARQLLCDNALAFYGERLRRRIDPQDTRPAGPEPAVRLGPSDSRARRFDPFLALSRAERQQQVEQLARQLEQRDGALDFERRTLAKREAYFRDLAPLRLVHTNHDVDDFQQHVRERCRCELDPRLRWLVATAKANEAESYGVELELERFRRNGVEGADPAEIYILLEERYHGRILLEACRTCGIEARFERPPLGMRMLIGLMQVLPASLRYVPVLCGETLACVVFQALRDGSSLFAEEPEVEERLRSLLSEILLDETFHAAYCRTRLGPLRIRVARWLVPIVAASFLRDIPQLRSLGCSWRKLVARARRGIEIPDGCVWLAP